MNKTEKKWRDAIVEYGCIVCRIKTGKYVQPIMHHITRGGRRIGHLYSIALCPLHHKGSGYGYHDGPKTFEAEHGAQYELLEETKKRIGWID